MADKPNVEFDAAQSNMFDVDSDDEDQQNNQWPLDKKQDDKDGNEEAKEEVKVARPTTKPTDRHRKKDVKASYTFWTEKDKEKLNQFP